MTDSTEADCCFLWEYGCSSYRNKFLLHKRLFWSTKWHRKYTKYFTAVSLDLGQQAPKTMSRAFSFTAAAGQLVPPPSDDLPHVRPFWIDLRGCVTSHSHLRSMKFLCFLSSAITTYSMMRRPQMEPVCDWRSSEMSTQPKQGMHFGFCWGLFLYIF